MTDTTRGFVKLTSTLTPTTPIIGRLLCYENFQNPADPENLYHKDDLCREPSFKGVNSGHISDSEASDLIKSIRTFPEVCQWIEQDVLAVGEDLYLVVGYQATPSGEISSLELCKILLEWKRLSTSEMEAGMYSNEARTSWPVDTDWNILEEIKQRHVARLDELWRNEGGWVVALGIRGQWEAPIAVIPVLKRNVTGDDFTGSR